MDLIDLGTMALVTGAIFELYALIDLGFRFARIKRRLAESC